MQELVIGLLDILKCDVAGGFKQDFKGKFGTINSLPSLSIGANIGETHHIRASTGLLKFVSFFQCRGRSNMVGEHALKEIVAASWA
jgi:hypothetical protein